MKPIPLRMKNGTPYRIQPCVEPDSPHTPDFLKDQIIKGLGDLSNQSRWQRFAGPLNRLSDSQLDYLASLDGKNRVAWCASVDTDNGERGIALARYIGLENEPSVAEFAITVLDAFQGQGIGQELMTKLIESARENHFDTLRGYVLRSNRTMLALSHHFSPNIEPEDASTLRVDIPLTTSANHP